MRKLFSLMAAVVLGLGLTAGDAEAKRFGSGKSIGKQREAVSQPAAPQKAPQQAPGAAPQQTGGSKWLGPLAGLAAGGLLASLFMGEGFGGALGSMLMLLALAAGIYFIFRALRRGPQAAPQPMRYAGYGDQTVAGMVDTGGGASPAPAVSASGVRPAWFEEEPFLRGAKVHFIRLQAAYDQKNLADIREYTTPAMFAEISQQLAERGDAANVTEVVTLDAAMIDVAGEGDLVIASVRFTGLIREADGAAAQPFDEIWHIQKSQSQADATWFVAGIQQVR